MLSAMTDTYAEMFARSFEQRRRRYASPLALAMALDRTAGRSPALDVIDHSLTALIDGDDTADAVAAFLPPQEGKSQLVSRRLPEWLLDYDPSLRIAVVSYEEDMALRWGRDIKQDVTQSPCRRPDTEECREACGGLHIPIRRDSSAAGRWETTAGGGVYCVGIGGPLTGRPVDCMRGDTEVMTETGVRLIRDIHESAGCSRSRVLSYNHATGRTEWQPVIASRAVPDRRLIEVVSASGRRFTCTPDHRVATQAGYKPACELAPGDCLTVLPGVRADVRDPGLRARQEGAARPGSLLLLAAVRGGRAARPGAPVQAVREADRLQGPRPPLLLRGVPGSGQAAEAAAPVPAMPGHVHAQEQPHDVLFAGLRQHRARSAHDRLRQLAVHDGHQLRGVVPAHEAADPRTRQGVPGLQAAGPDRAPHRSRAVEQLAGEPDPALRGLSRRPPQVEGDTVAVVRELRGERDTVYDLQVAGNRNFFAGQVLVHNCLIIDDPVKDRAAAESARIRDITWDWWESVALTRLAPGARTVLVQTRWHEDDLAGRIAARPSPLRWRVLRIPAIADAPGDPLGRPEGTELVSVRGRRPGHFANLRATMSPYVFSSIYQQKPVAPEGNFFRRASFRYWRWMEPWPDGRERIMCEGHPVTLDDTWVFVTMDFAASTRNSADYTVASVWAMTDGGDLILLDRVRDRVPDHEHFKMTDPLLVKWRASIVYVEQNWWSKTFVTDARDQGMPVAPVMADADKVTRAVPAAGRVHAGRVWFPAEAPWLDEWCDELAIFPSGSHDDQVDTLSYAARVVVHEWTPPREQARTAPTPWEHAVAAAHGSATGNGHGTLDIMNVPY